MNDDPEFMTVTEVAARWRVTAMTVRRHIAAGDLAAVRLGGQYRIRRSAMEAFEQGAQEAA